MVGEQYVFSAKRSDTGEWVNLRICEADSLSLDHMTKVWHKMSQSVVGHYKVAGRDAECPAWTSWMPHDWSRKTIADRLKFVVWDEDVLAGFLNLRVPFGSQFDPGRDIVYIEHLATSPGNQHTPIWNGRLQYIGLSLLAFAVLQSKERGLGGPVGLHATDESEEFYRHVNQTRHESLFHPVQNGVPGYYPGHEHQAYFEATTEGALKLLDEYRHA